MSDWRSSRPIALTIIVAVLTIQLAMPLARIGDDDAQRFGWQMFSKAGDDFHFVVLTTDGSEVPIALAEYMAMPRLDVDVGELIPPHLCRVVPDAVTVTWVDGTMTC